MLNMPAEDMREIIWMTDAEDEQERRAESVRREYDPELEIPELCRIISFIEREYETLTLRNIPYIDKSIFLEAAGYFEKRKLRERLQRQLRHQVYSAAEDVSDTDIEKARNAPIEELIEANRSHMAPCPFHEDKKPSFYIKNGFGFCFSCGAWADSIKYLMVTKNISFLDAVRALR